MKDDQDIAEIVAMLRKTNCRLRVRHSGAFTIEDKTTGRKIDWFAFQRRLQVAERNQT